MRHWRKRICATVAALLGRSRNGISEGDQIDVESEAKDATANESSRIRTGAVSGAPPDGKKNGESGLLRDEISKTDQIEIRGSRTDGRAMSLLIPAEKRSDVRSVMKELDSRSARIPHDQKGRMDFVLELVRAAPTQPVIATTKPGFRRKGTGFVTPTKMFGTAKRTIRLGWRQRHRPGAATGYLKALPGGGA